MRTVKRTVNREVEKVLLRTPGADATPWDMVEFQVYEQLCREVQYDVWVLVFVQDRRDWRPL